MFTERPSHHLLEKGSEGGPGLPLPVDGSLRGSPGPRTACQFPVSTPLLQGSGPPPSDLARGENRCGAPGSPTSVFFRFMAS